MTRMFARTALLLALWAPSGALGCTCVPSTVQSAWNNADHAFLGTVLRRRNVGAWNVYSVRVTRDAKSCLTPGSVVQLASPASAATCGTTFNIGDSKVFFAETQLIAGARRMVTTACSGNRDLAALNADDIQWLRSRYLTCAGSCLDPSVPVFNCLIDPCTVSPQCPGGTCVANYCGGCTAEFYDVNGYQVCVP